MICFNVQLFPSCCQELNFDDLYSAYRNADSWKNIEEKYSAKNIAESCESISPIFIENQVLHLRGTQMGFLNKDLQCFIDIFSCQYSIWFRKTKCDEWPGCRTCWSNSYKTICTCWRVQPWCKIKLLRKTSGNDPLPCNLLFAKTVYTTGKRSYIASIGHRKCT